MNSHEFEVPREAFQCAFPPVVIVEVVETLRGPQQQTKLVTSSVNLLDYYAAPLLAELSGVGMSDVDLAEVVRDCFRIAAAAVRARPKPAPSVDASNSSKGPRLFVPGGDS